MRHFLGNELKLAGRLLSSLSAYVAKLPGPERKSLHGNILSIAAMMYSKCSRCTFQACRHILAAIDNRILVFSLSLLEPLPSPDLELRSVSGGHKKLATAADGAQRPKGSGIGMG